MFRLLLLAMVVPLMSPWLQDLPPYDPAETRVPIVLVAANYPSDPAEAGFDPSAAARRVLQGAADRLRARGVAVLPSQDGDFVVAPDSRYDRFVQGWTPGRRALTLSVAFPQSALSQGSGTETRFGGQGDEAWRLASRVQLHMVGGLRDVLDYHSFDRGVGEQSQGDILPGSPLLLQDGDPWVAIFPLSSGNPADQALLEWPDTLDLLSTALADALSDYLSPGIPTPPRDPSHGWRQFTPWQPVAPRLVVEAERTTKVALTFDAASYPPLQPAILQALRDAGVYCTMFLTGDFVDAYPETVAQMARDGHEIANHSDTHPDMPSISSEAIVTELEALDAKVLALTGKSTRPWFRPPSGAYNDRVVQVAAQQGYHTIYWTADSADWQPEVDAATVRQRLLRFAAPGAILVCHLTSPQTAEVLPEVLRTLKERGLEFGTLSEVLGPLD